MDDQVSHIKFNHSAPIYALVLEKENAVMDWRDLAGNLYKILKIRPNQQ